MNFDRSPNLGKALSLVTGLAVLGLGLFGAGCSSTVDSEPGSHKQNIDQGSGGGGGGGGGEACDETPEDECKEFETQSCEGGQGGGGAQQQCEKTRCGWKWGGCYASSTPLVLSFDGAVPAFTSDAPRGFDLANDPAVVTDWPTAATPWLAFDRDGDGAIADGAELFGSMTRLASGGRAKNGFEALAELDADGDGQLTASDPAFASVRIWRDVDGDRRSTAGELVSLAEAGVVAIDLRYHAKTTCDARGNCAVERAPFTWRDGSGALRTGEVVDLHLPAQR